QEGIIPEDLDTRRTADVPPSFPNGVHVAEVEIDPETGDIQLAAYMALDDCGRVLQPVLVEGQVQGGVAQGVGQALLESGVYDDVSGQLLAGSLMDYAMPRAEDLPDISSGFRPVPCRTNPLGVKGVGEAGGHLVAMKREDKSGILRTQIATGKAWGTLGMGFGGREFARRVAGGGAVFIQALMAASEGRVVPAPGGVLIRDSAGDVMGAV